MLAKSVLITWLCILNLTASILFLFACLKLPQSRYRTLFLAFLVPYGLWANCLFIIHLVGTASSMSRTISQTIFASGALYHLLLGYLLISLAAPTQVKSWSFRFLALNTLFVGLVSYLGLWEQGIVFSPESGLAPVPGPALWYFNISLLIWALYYFSSIVIAYCRMPVKDCVRCQLKVLIWPAIFSMTMSLATNVVIPGLTKDYSLTAIGGFWLFVFFASIAYIIKIGSHLVLYETVNSFERRFTNLTEPSYEDLGKLVTASIFRARTISALNETKGNRVIARLPSS